METGTISSWSISEGSAFSAGDVICEIETDKATIDFEAQDDGIVAKILKQGDEAKDLPVGTPICVVVEEEDDVAAFDKFVAAVDEPSVGSDGGGGAEPPAEAVADATAAAAPPTPSSTTAAVPDRDVPPEYALMPSARSISQSAGVDATVLTGSGKGGRVTKGDVLRALGDGTYMPPLGSTSYCRCCCRTCRCHPNRTSHHRHHRRQSSPRCCHPPHHHRFHLRRRPQ